MYHRVASPGSDPWRLAVSPENFAEQMDVLKQHGAVVPLVRLSQTDRLPSRILAVTFDDAYQDNLDEALPVLDRAGVPATVFAVSGAIGTGRDYWWDALARVFLEAPVLPEQLSLPIAGCGHVITLGRDACPSPDAISRLREWDAILDPPPCRRARAYLFLADALKGSPPEVAEAVTGAVLDWAGVDRAGPPCARVLGEAGLRRLADAGPVTIGGHSVSHRALDMAPADEAAAEIAGCRTHLRALLNREIDQFAYPFGRHDRRHTPGAVRAAGFALACMTGEDLVPARPDPFRLPRIAAPDIGAEDFERFLRQVTGP